MSLDNPLSFFDVSGKVALITGASGAFGAVAARCLSGAGCRVALAAGNSDALARVAEACGGETLQINARPNSETACDKMEPAAFDAVMDANVAQTWLVTRAAVRQMKSQGGGEKSS